MKKYRAYCIADDIECNIIMQQKTWYGWRTFKTVWLRTDDENYRTILNDLNFIINKLNTY
jgi:hypothetical protein